MAATGAEADGGAGSGALALLAAATPLAVVMRAEACSVGDSTGALLAAEAGRAGAAAAAG
ncbi:MAG: hypothetical protein IT370_09130 [Deltaproteobacteria bacterium]|nr:hypothetical protein [Deltaproteobacteria bacterium]